MSALVDPSLGARLFPVVVVVAVAVGLLVGSFLNVVAYRAPRHLSVSTPRSFCPACRRQLAWWENVPLASWAVLGGRCHTCRASISTRYPAVEAGTGLVFGLVTWAWNGTAPAVVFCLLAAGAGALVLVEVEGRHPPLGLAAVALAVAGAAAVVVALAAHGVGTLVGVAAGVASGVVAFAVLRRVDPEGGRPWDRGRAVVLVAGAWVGGTQVGLPAASRAPDWSGPMWGVGAAAVVGVVAVLAHRVLAARPAALAAGAGLCARTGSCGTGTGSCGTGTGSCGTGTGSCPADTEAVRPGRRWRDAAAAVVGAPVVAASLAAMVASLAALHA
jgi:leader peptidase (prepilin peptidase)/N-methyltransferase